MTLKVVWGITGSGDKMPETVAAMAAVRERLDLEITAAISIAGVRVLRWYKLTRDGGGDRQVGEDREGRQLAVHHRALCRSVSTIACWWRPRRRTRWPRSRTASRTPC